MEAAQNMKTDRKARSQSVSRVVGSLGSRRMPRSRSAEFSTSNVRLSQLDRAREHFGNGDFGFEFPKRGNKFSSSFQTIFEKNELSCAGSGEDIYRGTLLSKSTQTVADGTSSALSIDADQNLVSAARAFSQKWWVVHGRKWRKER